MIEIRDLSKNYGAKEALNHINLTLPQGEIVGLFGENGAGKTTLQKCILGFLRHKGAVTLDGAPITYRNIARLSFATCEHSFFPSLTPKAHMEFYQMHFPSFRTKRFTALMEFFELPMTRQLRKFSVGQQNQFEVIMALSQGADYILMDEPFSGNDVFNREDFYKVLLGILELTETILLSTHLLEEVQHFISRAVLIHQGSIAADALVSDLEDQGKDLMTFVKETYHYRGDRVSKVLSTLAEDEEGGIK
ncbi:ABC transporter ATP-binding protein [Emergencia timonensis]|uniref:ATP-binding cassette domain-containing protein n=1 Tax=Emergencia timonensis TaxID=1776384 RepID=UPI001D07EA68|nr:ABC transporter ATP-binding protein [Emergencia timonensis]MBS6178182.1 ABC transporter ATP-binding protein [Clostridiales bacterium]MCB6475797.1 ABC transporter ATP-binding protein [Emergencia timonensis]